VGIADSKQIKFKQRLFQSAIRSSEKVFWRKVLDIYATSIDYDPNTDLSRRFLPRYKMRWAASCQNDLINSREVSTSVRI
jgi:hypothetical protein